MSDSLADFVQSLPKTETHLHLEGALPLELLQRVRPEFRGRAPDSWAPDFKFADFAHFERELLEMAFAWFTSPERYHEAAKLIFARHLAQNVRYVETSFASGGIEFLGFDGRAVLDAIRAAVPAGLEVRIFLGIHHDGAGPKMMPVLADALTWPGLAGIDLHGFEDKPLEPWTAEYWAAARKADDHADGALRILLRRRREGQYRAEQQGKGSVHDGLLVVMVVGVIGRHARWQSLKGAARRHQTSVRCGRCRCASRYG